MYKVSSLHFQPSICGECNHNSTVKRDNVVCDAVLSVYT
jgi:hypothetical protein